jgi:ABC-type antimicrobial peptide transport system permease subunit
MQAQDFRIGWRLLLQERAYSAVSILGLAVGFAACFLLLGFVHYCLSYNSHVPDAARVYSVKQRINVFPRPDWGEYAYLPIQTAAEASGMVEASSIAKQLDLPLWNGAQRHQVELRVVDPAFEAMFGLRALEGDVQAALARPDGIALTASTARKIFGAAPALNQYLRVRKETLQVLAVLADPPANATLRYDGLLGSASAAWPEPERGDHRSNFQRRGGIYLKLKPGADAAQVARLLQGAVNADPRDAYWRNGPIGKKLNGRNVTDVAMVAMPDVYFDEDLASGRNSGDYGQRGSVFALAGIALLILLLAASNYVNLATVRTLRRQREIGMRKLLGASHARLVAQFLTESSVVALLATVLGLGLAWLCLPMFSGLVARQLDSLFSPASCVLALLGGLLAGLCAGIYPAVLALRVRPAAALAGRGDHETAGGLWLRRVLTVLQFATAMALSGATLAIAWQADYAAKADRGFDPAGMLVLDLPQETGKPAADGFMQALARMPNVRGVAAMSEAAGRDGMKMVATLPGRTGEMVSMEYRTVSPEFFQVYGLKPLHGRLFDPARDQVNSQARVVNAAAALALGFATPEAAVGQFLTNGDRTVQIVGIAPEVRYQSLKQMAQPVAYRIAPAQVLAVRTSENAAAAHASIAPLFKQYFPDSVLELQSAASLFGLAYADDVRLARMLASSSLIAVVLAACGIYVLSAYSVQRSRKEIVLRKLHGAGRAAIARLVGREFAVLIVAGAVLGLPLAALAIRRYLAGYVEHAPMGAWPLLAALLLAALVALLATARHTLAALRISPALALRG